MKLSILEDGTRSEVSLDQPVISIGRSVDNDIRLANTLVSRHHCRIELVGDAVWALDLGSANGTRVNGERMHANVIEAAEQCGILRVPEIAAPERLDRVLASWDASRRLIFCDEGAPNADPIAALREIGPGPLAVLIGPEGGFAPEEREALIALPFVTRIAMGPRIMRADTAAVAALTLVNAVLGDWR